MANGFYTKGLENMCSAGFNWTVDDFRIFFCDHGVDVPNTATDDALDDITGGAVIATSPALSGKTNTGGVLDASDPTFSAVTGASFESATIYKHTGTPSTSKLWGYWDTITGLPFTPTGIDVLFIFDNGANKVMAP